MDHDVNYEPCEEVEISQFTCERKLQLEPLPASVFYGKPFVLTAYYRLRRGDVLRGSISYDGGATFSHALPASCPVVDECGSYTWGEVTIPQSAPDAPIVVIKVHVHQAPAVSVVLSAGLVQSRRPGITFMWNSVPYANHYSIAFNNQWPQRIRDPHWSGDLPEDTCIAHVKAANENGTTIAECSVEVKASGIADVIARLKLHPV